jgi:hypothetical protein
MRLDRLSLTKPFSNRRDAVRKQTPPSLHLDQTTRFGHVGAHHQLSLSRAVQAVFERHSASTPLGMRSSAMISPINMAIYAFGAFMLLALAIGFFAAPV